MNKKEFEENYIFEKYKDTALKGSKEFRKKVEKHINIDVSSVYTRIIKYQVNTYGETLNDCRDAYQDNIKLQQKAYGRNKSRRKIRGTWKSPKEKRWQVYE